MTDGVTKNPKPARKKSVGENVRAAIRKLRGGDVSARKLAASVALGLFVGSTPFYGLHSLITAGLAVVLRLDLLVAYVASNISLPPVIPFLLFAEAQIGARLIQGRWLDISLHELRPERAFDLGLSIVVGSGVVATSLALLGAVIVFPIGMKLEKTPE